MKLFSHINEKIQIASCGIARQYSRRHDQYWHDVKVFTIQTASLLNPIKRQTCLSLLLDCCLLLGRGVTVRIESCVIRRARNRGIYNE